jgi:hypothetical protein
MRSDPLLEDFLESSQSQFRSYKRLAEQALEQVEDPALFRKGTADSNSLAILLQHLGGNMRSRWTDFLTSDGEKPWRDRDGEFEEGRWTREQLMAQWEEGWTTLFDSVSALSLSDLSRTVLIRGEPISVIHAIMRQLTHAAYHVGQIVYLCKALAASEWRTLSIPKRKSPPSGTPATEGPGQ